jgi:hypothetical protein
MNNVEEYVLSYNSPSIVTFSPQIDENDSKSPSDWNPDWTIQREISITIEYRQFLLISYSILIFFFSKSLNELPELFSKKCQILSGIAISLALILSIFIPIIILTITPNLPSTT